MSIFDLVLTGLGEISEKIPNNYDLSDKNADFGHFGPFLACFWPVSTSVSAFKALNEYICPYSDLIECVWQEILKKHSFFEKKWGFWLFWAIFGLFLASYSPRMAAKLS